jgi:glutaredoxin 3
MRFFQLETCPYCARVRARMQELELTFVNTYVPRPKPDRKELLEVSGQYGVPTLVTDDGQVIADDDDAIIAYLEKNFAKQA